jgi:hypothetical protein
MPTEEELLLKGWSRVKKIGEATLFAKGYDRLLWADGEILYTYETWECRKCPKEEDRNAQKSV